MTLTSPLMHRRVVVRSLVDTVSQYGHSVSDDSQMYNLTLRFLLIGLKRKYLPSGVVRVSIGMVFVSVLAWCSCQYWHSVRVSIGMVFYAVLD